MTPKPPRQDNATNLGDLASNDQLRLLWRVYQQSGEGVLITDRNNRIIAANAAFARMAGYTEAEVLGLDPKLLAACPKQATMTVIRDDREQVTHYVATFSDPSSQKTAAEHIVRLAHHDDLTGLLNRHALQGQLEHTLASARREGKLVAVLLIDLDRFKDINDSLGHPVGDCLLIEMAKRLTSSVRASDIVARLGGDEFVVVLPDVENALTVTSIASKLRRNLADLYRIDEHSLYATPSIGITLFPMDGDSADVLIKNADTAMYHAKAAGRDNFKFFAASMNAAATERLKLETALRQALESATLTNAQFRLEYQPQLHLGTGRVIGLEALARWHHPQLGAISPVRFIPVAEETGLIQPLGDWVFWEACRQLRVFKDQGIRDVRVAVNLSAQQLREEALPSLVRGALACYDLRPGDLELEITESAAMQNPEITIGILERLSDIGIVLAIDDFGTGYSSLAYLKRLPINRLKLDRSFVHDINQDKKGAAICSATIVLGHDLGLDLVAEGVETTEQRDLLRDLGCDAMQGFLYCRPLPADRVVDFLLEQQTHQAA